MIPHEVTVKKRALVFAFISILLLLTAGTGAFSAEHLSCAECGMLVDKNAPFSAKIIAGKQDQYFCDIGDMLLYLREKKIGPTSALVRDYRSGDWTDAAKAFYVHAPRRFTTPMGWSIAAFRERSTAEEYGTAASLESMLKAMP
jgi:nitrous oxide reductase accessory protein NosL